MSTADKQAGFTLLELMIYVVMVSLLMLAMVGFFGVMLNGRIKGQTISEVEQQGKFAMENIARTVRNSTAITTPAAAATGTTLQVSVPTASLSPTIFNLNGTSLQVKEGTSNAVAMTDSKVTISNLSFKNLTRSGTPGVVQISFTVTKVNSVNKAEYSYSETFTTSVARRAP